MRTRLLAVCCLVALAGLLPLLTVCTRDDGGGLVSIESLRSSAGNSAAAGVQDPSPAPSPAAAPTPAPPSAPPPKRVAVSPVEVLRGPADVPKISLIINAGAGYSPAPEILDVLAAKGVHTTFFLMGWWAEKNPEIVRRIDAEGHEIASHGYQVFDLTQVSDAAVIDDLEHADAVLKGITGKSTRPLWSASASARDARVNGIAARLGYRPIVWTQDSGDWREDATAAGVYRQALAGARNGAIIVMHMDSPQSHTSTALILGQLIDALRAQGLEPVTISDLVGE